jgi:hypothetical protein
MLLGGGYVKYLPLCLQGAWEIPAAPAQPTDPREIRKIMRSKMHRCKRCRNRFIEKGLYERHMQLRHYDDYVIYMAQQEEVCAE